MLVVEQNAWKSLIRKTRDPQTHQWHILQKIIRENAQTTFGEEHGFASLISYEEYRAAVPIHTYEELRSYIEAQNETKHAQLTAEHPVAFAQTSGVMIRHWLSPARLLVEGGAVAGVEFSRTLPEPDGSLQATEQSVTLVADRVFKAIGQTAQLKALGDLDDALRVARQRIWVDASRKTSLDDVWAGGDCVSDGEDLTVSAVQDGKLAAISIDQYLRQG